MLAKDESQRPAAAEVARTLESRSPAFRTESVSDRPLRPPQSHKRKRLVSGRWRSGVAALVAISLAVGAVWWVRSDRQELAFEPVPLTAIPGSEEGPIFSPDGSQVAFRGNQHNGWRIYVKLIGGGPPLRLTSDPATHWYPAWSPDGKWIAFTARHDDGRNGLFLMPALGGPERLLAELVGDWRSTDWSPDGKWIAVSPGWRLQLRSTEQREVDFSSDVREQGVSEAGCGYVAKRVWPFFA